MKKKWMRLLPEQKKEFIRRNKSLFDRCVRQNSVLARYELRMKAVHELGYSPKTYWPDMGFEYLYDKMYPREDQ